MKSTNQKQTPKTLPQFLSLFVCRMWLIPSGAECLLNANQLGLRLKPWRVIFRLASLTCTRMRAQAHTPNVCTCVRIHTPVYQLTILESIILKSERSVFASRSCCFFGFECCVVTYVLCACFLIYLAGLVFIPVCYQISDKNGLV